MIALLALGLSAAVVYGTSDFLGGVASTRLSSAVVTLLAFVAGTVVSVMCLPLVASRWSSGVLPYGALAGVTAAGSIWLLYTALSIGPVSVIAPLVALIASLLSVVYGLGHHEALRPLGYAAMPAALVAAVLVGYEPRADGIRVRVRGLAVGIAAGLATGAYLIALDLTPTRSGAAPIVIEFAVGTLTIGIAVILRAGGAAQRGRSARVNPQHHVVASARTSAVALASGGLQAIADVLVILGIHNGQLAVMAVLLALYPIGTIICAHLILHEQPNRRQIAGIVLAIGASAALGAAATTPRKSCTHGSGGSGCLQKATADAASSINWAASTAGKGPAASADDSELLFGLCGNREAARQTAQAVLPPGGIDSVSCESGWGGWLMSL